MKILVIGGSGTIGKKVNVVCSDLVEDSYEKYKDYFLGKTPVPMHKIVDGYVKCVEGKINGRILRIMA